MSYDFNVLVIDPNTGLPIGACDHQQSFERYIVNNDDFRTLNYALNPSINMRAPINGATSVQIWIAEEQIKSTDPVYGWQVLLDPDRIEQVNGVNTSFYKIVFNNPVRLVLPLIEVSYITQQPYCMKCSGLGTLNDFKIGASGDPIQVTQVTKLAQKALKWVLTSQDAFYPTFVCAVKDYIGRKLGQQITEVDVQTEVMNALSSMQQVQQAQGTVQTLDPQEILKEIVSITVTLDPDDPTALIVSAVISNYSGQTAPIGFSLRTNQ
jgi:hypothetical protein